MFHSSNGDDSLEGLRLVLSSVRRSPPATSLDETVRAAPLFVIVPHTLLGGERSNYFLDFYFRLVKICGCLTV